MQTNNNSHSLNTPSISKIHPNLQNTLHTLFWLIIDFDSPTQSSEGRHPHFTKKQPRSRAVKREAPLTGLKEPEQDSGCGPRTRALSLCHPFPDRALRREWAVADGSVRSPFWGFGGRFRGLSPFWSSSSLRKTTADCGKRHLSAGVELVPVGLPPLAQTVTAPRRVAQPAPRHPSFATKAKTCYYSPRAWAWCGVKGFSPDFGRV